ncbi:hypothetical protein PUN28_010057 [Cardiocondyla obscurior]|uniref:Uncharacterized protein n=1 Tax=Cardiocondyla obscurior TaxID=286306 RepID=A0AAW2FNT2_9HYME
MHRRSNLEIGLDADSAFSHRARVHIRGHVATCVRLYVIDLHDGRRIRKGVDTHEDRNARDESFQSNCDRSWNRISHSRLSRIERINMKSLSFKSTFHAREFLSRTS